MATLTNQLHTVGIYITTGTVHTSQIWPLSEALHYPNQAPRGAICAKHCARASIRSLGSSGRNNGSSQRFANNDTASLLRAGIRTQWSRRRCPPRLLARNCHRPTRQRTWYCIASSRELFTGSAAGCMRVHSSICGTTDSGVKSFELLSSVILPAPMSRAVLSNRSRCPIKAALKISLCS